MLVWRAFGRSEMAREFLIGCTSCAETIGVEPVGFDPPTAPDNKLILGLACKKCGHRMEVKIAPCKDGHVHVTIDDLTATSYAN